MILSGKDDGNAIVYRKFALFLAGSLLIGSLIVLYIFLNIAGSNDRIRLVRFETVKHDLEKEQKELRLNIEFLSSPERLEIMARDRFKMTAALGDRVYIVPLKDR